MTRPGYVQLPDNVSELNDYMCAPLNRKGLVCSECIDHFGPSVTSYGYPCSKCKNSWLGILFYLVLELLPITVFYLLILIFRIDVISPPMTCFVLYSQFVFCGLEYLADDHSAGEIMFKTFYTIRLGTKIILTLCGILRLDFFLFFLPEFCISSRLKPTHTALLGYSTAFYPLMLVLLTCICIELHDRNFRPIVCLWKPIHKCLTQLQKGWGTTNNIVNVFASFFLLAYGRVIYQTFLLVNCQCFYMVSEFAMESEVCAAYLDSNISCWSTKHLLFVIPAVLISFMFNLLPACLLVLYPSKIFRASLSRCRLDSIALNLFIDKFNCYYRDGIDGGRDMRSFSGLYFFQMVVAFTIYIATRNFIGIADHWFSKGILFWITALTIAFIKPYKKTYMNMLDSLLLANLGLLCSILSLPSEKYFKSHYVLVTQLLCLLPFVVLILYIAVYSAVSIKTLVLTKVCRGSCCAITKHSKDKARPGATRFDDPLPAEHQQLITHPSVTVISYGTRKD